MAEEELTDAISLRISKTDRQLLDGLVARLPLKAHAIARHALRIGLLELDANPARLFTEKKTTKGKR